MSQTNTTSLKAPVYADIRTASEIHYRNNLGDADMRGIHGPAHLLVVQAHQAINQRSRRQVDSTLRAIAAHRDLIGKRTDDNTVHPDVTIAENLLKQYQTLMLAEPTDLVNTPLSRQRKHELFIENTRIS